MVTVFKLFPLSMCCMDKMGTVTDLLLKANTSGITYP